MSKAEAQPNSRFGSPVAAVQAFLKKRRMHWSRAAVHAAMPLWFIGLGILYLVSNPADDSLWLVHNMGFTGFLVLVFSLACTPLAFVTGWSRFTRLRRTFGLWGYWLILVHVILYISIWSFFEWRFIFVDITTIFIYQVGFIAFFLMSLLAFTSYGSWQRRLKRNWVRLHRLAYVIVPLGGIHYVYVEKRPDLWVLIGVRMEKLSNLLVHLETPPDMWVLLFEKPNWPALGEQLTSRPWMFIELALLLLLLRLPAIRRNVIKWRRALTGGPGSSKTRATRGRPATASRS